MTTFTQLTARLKNILRGWLLVLGLKEGLLECATVCVKSEIILKCLWCANYILLRKNLLWYRKSKMHRCWVCSIYVGKCYKLKTNRLKWHFLLLKMQPNCNSIAPCSIFLECIKNSNWTLSIQSITEWQVAKFILKLYKTSLNMFNLYKHKTSFPMIKDNKTKNRGKGGGQAPTHRFWQIN